MSDTQNELLSFLSNDTQADTASTVKSQEVEHEELDTDESETEDYDTDGYDDEEDDEESTADSDEENDEDEDDSTDEDTEANKFDDSDFDIVVDGETLTVKGSELKSGYMRYKDYTKKTQEIATTRQNLDAELTKAIERSEAVKFNAITELEKFDAVIKQFGGWDGLRRNSTPEDYEQFNQRYVMVKRDADITQDIYNETVNTMRNNNAKQIESIFKDMSMRHANFTPSSISDMDKFLTSRNFTEDMVLSMTSPDAWDLVYEAMQYEKLQARTKETVKAEKKESTAKKSAPVKKQAQKATKSRAIEKGLKAQKSTTGAAQSKITQDLLRQILK